MEVGGNNKEADGACTVCIVGQYQDQEDQSSCKDDCDAGSYITAIKTACSVCNLGQYQDQDDQSSCKDDCGAGSYITADKSSCTGCNVGQLRLRPCF